MAIETSIKRRKPEEEGKTKGGRPSFEDLTELTPEMEDVAQLTSTGFTVTEIVDKLQYTTEKVQRFLKLSIVKNRIKLLLRDNLVIVAFDRDRLRSAIVESLIRLLKQDKLPVDKMSELLKMLDPYERLMLFTKDEQKLVGNKKQIGVGGTIVGSNISIPDNDEPKKTIFGKEEIE